MYVLLDLRDSLDPSTSTPPAADNTLLYAGIGIVAVVAVVVAALAMRGRKKA